MEYDRYGFLMCAGEEETDDVLVAKANKLQRQSDEINSRIKVYMCFFFSVCVSYIRPVGKWDGKSLVGIVGGGRG